MTRNLCHQQLTFVPSSFQGRSLTQRSHRFKPQDTPRLQTHAARLGAGQRGRPAGLVRAAAGSWNGNGNGAAMKAPYNVVITGSTKGVGLALSQKFLEAGDSVVVCSREPERVRSTLETLQGRYGKERVHGGAFNVTEPEDVAGLAELAKERLGHVDLWINNAGTNAYAFQPLVEASVEDIATIVATNTLGVMLCCRQAIQVMREQPRGGHIFNVDGAGADGNATPRFAAYGATKRGLAQFTKSLQAEIKLLDIPNVTVHNLSPGMVTTDLLMAGANRAQARFFINALAEPPEVVAEYLVPRIRDVPLAGHGKSSYIRYLTLAKAYSQIAARLLFSARKDLYVKEA